ncbi:hypothetical protein ACWOC1_06945 [Enterococcus quebecensis]|uniref:hypothetical protein n=1 Tax=Enterococcus quebecensis TaxID=903983 RepID=UPI00114CC66C|nr:hypothetical protein [Enterococcus quebecensis]
MIDREKSNRIGAINILFERANVEGNSTSTVFSTRIENKNELTNKSMIDDPFSDGYEGEFYEPDEWPELTFD